MDVPSRKRLASGAAFGRKGLSLPPQGSIKNSRSIQSCNRLGCSTRHNTIVGSGSGGVEKIKTSVTVFRSSNKAAVSSSRPNSSSVNIRKSRESKNPASISESVTEESGRKNEHRGKIKSLSRRQGVMGPVPVAAENRIASSLESQIDEFSVRSSGHSSASAKLRPQKQVSRQTGSGNQDASSRTVSRRCVTSKNGVQPVRPLQEQSPNTRRNDLRNLTCTAISDALSSGCSSFSSSESMHDRDSNAYRSSNPNGGSSNSIVKNRIGSLGVRTSGYLRTTVATTSRVLENSLSLPACRRTRTQFSNGDNKIAVRTRKARNGNNVMRLAMDIDNGQDIINDGQLHNGEATLTRPSRSSRLEALARRSSSRSSSTRDRQVSRIEENSAQMFHGHLEDLNVYRRMNMEGIAEVLLVLERFEQDEELSNEELLVLENNYLRGFGLHDQHREMRLDIDNMSYEELLDLGEKMGTVSTALTEEALSKCLKKSIYVPATINSFPNSFASEDVKCSICQEEYAAGDEVGELDCHHLYHVACIHKWLGQKNWCPICKASASPS